jgi:flavin reductase (DIM6/NTAB) family NADH-FMN oxidoreductase RutF
MPMVMVGAMVEDKVNFMTVAWVSRVNFKPPMIGVALGPHFTNKGIDENGTFSINIPSVSLMEKTDYCGIVSGTKVDKSSAFSVFYGELKTAPMIEECPVCIACKLYDKVKLPSNTLYIGEVVETYSEERYLTNRVPDIKKTIPFVLTMPDNNYWEIGINVGKAWSSGKKLK